MEGAITKPEDVVSPQPRLLKDPFGWYAMQSCRRPRAMFAAAWTLIVLMCAAGLPMFGQTDPTEYDWYVRTLVRIV